MKLEREPVFGHITLNHKPDPKSFDYNDLSLDSTGLKSGKVMKETQNGNLHDFKDSEKDVSQLLYLMDDGNGIAASKLDSFEKTDNLKSHKEYQAEDFVAPFTKFSSEIGSLEKDSDCYIDKSAIKCEMPEFQVCSKDNGYSSVKDICIDEGVHSNEKILFERGADKESLRTFLFPDKDLNKQLGKEHEDVGIFSPNGLKSSAEYESNKELDCESKDLVHGVDVHNGTTDKIGNDISQAQICPENVVLMKETGQDNTNSRSLIWDSNAVTDVQMSSDKADETTHTVSRSLETAAEELKNNNEEAPATTASDPAAEESNSGSLANELSYSSKVEKRRITFDFDSLAPVTNVKEDTQKGIPGCLDTENTCPDNNGTTCMQIVTPEECPQNGICGRDETPNVVEDGTCDALIASTKAQHESDIHECVETPNTSSVDNEISPVHGLASQLQHVTAKKDRLEISDSGRRPSTDTPVVEDGLSVAQVVSGHFQYGVGESSFSAAGPVSGRINYSGPIPYSGSISLRSDSSTTSTRSFAFPVLQTEWNSSPVRMAQADRRHFRKHRGWRQGILCCRF